MKKGIAILFTAIILLAGIQQTLSLHLCANTLFSAALYQGAESNTCCDEPMEATCHITPGEDEALKRASSDTNAYQEDCCEFQTIEIFTDNFTFEQLNTTIQQSVVSSYLPIWAVVNYLFNLFTPDTLINSNNHISPPLELYNSIQKFLSFICIYRI